MEVMKKRKFEGDDEKCDDDVDIEQHGRNASVCSPSAAAMTSSSDRLCGTCGEAEAKYTCPGCGVRSCSLICVKQHKANTSCDGKRGLGEYSNLRELRIRSGEGCGGSEHNDRIMRRDYAMLEDTLRACESASRNTCMGDGRERGKGRIGGSKLPVRLAMLVQTAASKGRGTRLRIMPEHATRRKENTTVLVRKRDKKIMWRVEWFFAQANATYVDERVDENTTVARRLEDIVTGVVNGLQVSQTRGRERNSMTRHKLRKYKNDIDDLRVLMKLENRPANSPQYATFDLTKSIRENLSGLVVIEFPKLVVISNDNEMRKYCNLDGSTTV